MTDLDELTLPPRRPLPDEVRDRLRLTVLTGLRPAGPDRRRMPLAVAAVVAVLVAGATIVIQSVSGPANHTPPARPTPSFDSVKAEANLDRCWRALADKQARVPHRDKWAVVFMTANAGRTVTAARADGRPLFCETTPTTVTVSDPNAASQLSQGTATEVMLLSPDGAIGGVTDPAWQRMALLVSRPDGEPAGIQANVIKDGLFVDFTPFGVGTDTRVIVRREEPGRPDVVHPWQTLPPPPAPLVSTVDNQLPADPTAEMTAFFTECKAGSSGSLDWTGWDPVAIAGTAPYRAMLLRSGDRVRHCTAHPAGHGLTYSFDPVSAMTSTPVDPMPYHSWQRPIGVSGSAALLGLVRSDVVTMLVDGPGMDTVQVPVRNGGFGAILPPASSDPEQLTVVLRDAAGAEIYRGPLPTR